MAHESALIQQFALEYAQPGQGMKLLPSDGKPGDMEAGIKTAQMRLKMQEFDKVFHSSWWGAMMTRLSIDEQNAIAMEGLKKIEEMFVKLMNGKDYLSGTAEPNLLDLYCYPMVERAIMMENSPWHDGFVKMGMKEQLPVIYAFVHRMREHPVFGKHKITEKAYNNLLLGMNSKEMG